MLDHRPDTVQATITKDNSAVVESTGQSVSDGSKASRDDGQTAGLNAVKDQGKISGGDLISENENVLGDVDIGDGSTLTIENSDSDTVRQIAEDAFGLSTSTVQEALDANQFVSEDAFDLADEVNYRSIEAVSDTAQRSIDLVERVNLDSLASNRDVTEGAFDFADEVNYRALSEIGETNETLSDTLRGAFEFARISQDSANQASQQANSVLAQKSQDAPSAISETLQKNVLVGLGIVAAALLVYRLPNK